MAGPQGRLGIQFKFLTRPKPLTNLPVSNRALTPQRLWEQWPGLRFVNTPAPCLRPQTLLSNLQALASRYPHDTHLEEIGRSFLDRPIHLLKLGVGEKSILFWSQMHGDEPSATPALLDMADYLLANAGQAGCRSILENFTLLMIPMLNPDGAERYERINGQGLDINRDALRLATPEGRLLKQVRDEYQPMLGMNLHDQGRMTTVGNTGRLATVSLLAVSGDADNTLTRGRLRSKRACAAIVDALGPLIPGGIARYDEEWSPLAFGDNMTAWGTPVVLIESGGLPFGYEVTDLTRLNFVALLMVMKGLAGDDLSTHNPQIYEDLPENQTGVWSDVVVRGGYVLQPGAARAFRCDLAFNYLHNGRQVAGCSEKGIDSSQISLTGDASCHAAGTSVNANENVLLAAFEFAVSGWSNKEWLGRENLTRLAQMGIATICWAVREVELVAARAHAKAMLVTGLPRLEVVTDSGVLPAHVLSGPPRCDTSKSLFSILDGLGVGELAGTGALNGLWRKASAGERRPAGLVKDRPASFLMVSSTRQGQLDLKSSQLQGVWLDGHEVRLK